LLVALAAAASLPACSGDAGARDVSVDAYDGLGTWVDVFDYVPGFQGEGQPPPVTVKSVDDMAVLGVRTLYLQAAQDDPRIFGDTVPRGLLGRFLRRAHSHDMKVVAWYVPHFDDLAGDLRRIEALHHFRSDGQRFDGLALDIEFRDDVPDPVARSQALVALSRQARRVVGSDRALGAIVLEPLLLDVVNDQFWPGFPWRRLAPLYDVWLPMTYWTNRDSSSGLRDGFVYTDGNVRRLRHKLADADAAVHAIGGIADSATARDYDGFVRAARARDAIGWSVYDFNTTTTGVWARLRP
jgi:hypothetical protein